ncbi:phosphate signaling complex protein PhoU [Streptococcus acidominimus]|uniref:Phosphate-specific transport system accessory protein PhoU n=1 Tax=Streptococcus acidominimus TaxID=1326 RepID=A0A1Q8EG50_STRAI|nr:phosphate signaling complex protein PhoU [Streptococcus acidominimus]MBF0847522.1 phosphate signaling complex protein PhoU [Streptococcus danieliae]MBF0818051.1 phosphate signaling complex protein PhoU [Streptococcus acidominimus]MBF0838755.1 phosphate signaling complex protein PhoU [Streptococcus acidominimus]OLF50791.1 phosphate transport system regulatory protein PhoU [Streptococcus acidominimus]TFU31770.1 phosphate signaling complex protein PhoU [Streptococcus acidominimus]
MRTRFESQLEALQKDMMFMGGLCEEMIAYSAERLTGAGNLDEEVIQQTYQQIEELERDIEARCLKLLLRQQPVARDLRTISSALKMVYDMKRIGAQSSEVADLISHNTIHLVDEIPLVKKMAEQVSQMVVGSLDAFVKESDALAQEVIAKDDTVDQYFGTIKEKLASYLGKQSVNGDQAIDLLMIAKYLERIGDHAVNIAKWVQFAITGQLEG